MKLEEALKTNKKIIRKSDPNGSVIQWCKKDTDKYKGLVACSYFILNEDGKEFFSTSVDLYPNELFADDWEVLEK